MTHDNFTGGVNEFERKAHTAKNIVGQLVISDHSANMRLAG